MSTAHLLLVFGAVLVGVPFVVYLSVKLGTYAFFRGRELFEQKNKKEHNGS